MYKYLTAIIPTKNRVKDLVATMESLLIQTVPFQEVIVVDQSIDTAGKGQVSALFQNKTAIVLKYIHDTKIKGAAQARNVGIRQSQGDVIFLFDDDVVLERDYVAQTLKTYEELPGVMGVGGVITNNQYLATGRIKWFKNIFNLGIFKDKRVDIFARYQEYNKPIRTDKLSGGVSSYQRKVFDQEWFDEKLDWIFGGYSIGEDIDFSLRVAKRYPLIINPFARLVHNQGERVNKEKANQIYLESASWTYIFLKTFSGNLIAWLCYLWLCCGWILRCLKNMFMLDFRIIRSLCRGIRDGFALCRKKTDQKDGR